MADFELIDSHAHLTSDQYEQDRDNVLKRAQNTGVGIVSMGIDLATSQQTVELADRHDGVYAAVGFHPHEAKYFSEKSLEDLRSLVGPNVRAVGEIGLDYYRNLSPRDDQQEAFVRQLSLAVELGLPVSIHNRKSTDDMLRLLRSLEELPKGAIHSFSGPYELAEEFIALGFFLGISGPVTFQKEDGFREVVKRISLENLLLETDSPYLTPHPHRGKRNEPVYVRYVAKTIADTKGISRDEVSRKTTDNAGRLFGINGY